LRHDWCWCRWRTSAEGHCRWGLQVCRRQVGLDRGIRWPTGSSAGRMVARTIRWSRGQFLSWASKPRSSRNFVGAESWVVIGGGYTEFVGFRMVHHKNHWVTWLSQTAKGEDSMWLTDQNRYDRFVKPVWPVWGRRAPRCFEAEDTRHDRKSCVSGTRACCRCASVRWC
jgi:hypothetical protein